MRTSPFDVTGFRSRSWKRRTFVAIAYVTAAAIIAVRLWTLSEGRTFFFDEWDFVVERHEWSWEALAASHNGHPSFLTAAIYILLLNIFGLGNFSAFLAVGIFFHLAVCGLASGLVSHRLGATAGVSAFLALGLLGAGWQNSLWPFQIGFMGSLAGFLAAVVLLDCWSRCGSEDAKRWMASGSALSLVCSVVSSGVGLPALVGICLWILVRWKALGATWWVPAPALLIYGSWYSAYGGNQASGSPEAVPRYIAESAAFSVGGFFGVDLFWGAVAFGLGVGVISARLLRNKSTLSPVWIPAFGFLFAFWTLTAISRGLLGDPGASRYVYIGAVIGLVGSSATFPVTLRGKQLFISLAIVGVLASSSTLSAGAGGLRYEGEMMRTLLAWVDVHGDLMEPELVVDEQHSPQLTVGGYRSAVEDLRGLPADGIDLSLVTGSFAQRLDLLVARSSVLQTAPSYKSCAQAAHTTRFEFAPGATVNFTIATDLSLDIRRFAPDTPSASPVELPPGTYRITAPKDPWSQNYTVIVQSADGVQVCPGRS